MTLAHSTPPAPPETAATAAGERSAPAGTRRRAAVTHASYGRGSLAWLLAPLALGVVVVAAYLARGHREPAASVAVLPLALGTGDPASEVLAGGIREGLTGALGRLPELTVVANDSTSQLEGAPADPRRAGRQLGVHTLVTGRVVRQGDALALSAELLAVADGARLWSGSFVRPLAELPAVQAALAEQVALALRPALAPAAREALRRRPTDDPAALQLYMKGRHHASARTAQGREDAASCFRQAAHADGACALAHAALAEVLAAAGDGGAPAGDALAQARAAAERALALDPLLAEGHAALGLVELTLAHDPAAAERPLRRALELAPSCLAAQLRLAEALAELGRQREAAAALRRARALDPLGGNPLLGELELRLGLR